MKTGIFGGAFNPIHNGHLALAENYYKSLGLDRIFFIPTSLPPHKTSEYLAPADDRLNMARIATAQNPAFVVSDIEFDRQGKSYTYDTVMQLKADFPEDEFFLIIGADQFLTFHEWYRYEDILDMVTLCTSARESEQEKRELYEYAAKCDKMRGRYYIANYPVILLSSSQIREKVKNKEDISHLVPYGVEKYILEKGLYIV